MRNMRKALIITMVFALGLLVSQLSLKQSVDASSATTYTLAINRKGYYVITQNAYLPDKTVFDFGVQQYAEANPELEIDPEEYGLNRPSDLFIDDNDDLFIADTGHSRIIVFRPSTGETIDIITDYRMKSPRGLFITNDGDLYVADNSSKAIFKFRYIDDQDILDRYADAWTEENLLAIDNALTAAMELFRTNPLLDFVTDEEMELAILSGTLPSAADYMTQIAISLGYFTSDAYKEAITEETFNEQFDSIDDIVRSPLMSIPEEVDYSNIELGWHIIESFGKPTSVSFDAKTFEPKKVAVDNQDNMFIVAEGMLEGVVQLSDSGEFLGFFAQNKVVLSPQEQLEEIILTDAQLETRSDRNPPAFSNVFVDKNGIKYSTSFGDGISNLKKHNTDGSSNIDNVFQYDLELLDLYVDRSGIIYTASALGWIDVWTSDGDFIFEFGSYEGDTDVAGLYSELVSIAVDSNGTIYTLDTLKNFVQSFTPTEYSETIYKALNLYREGQYDDAVVEWDKVLKLNQLSVLAHQEIGRNLFSSGEYEEAMLHFELAGRRDLYSEAYWEVRNIDLQRNLPLYLILIIFGSIAYYTVKFTNRKYAYVDNFMVKVKKLNDIKIISDLTFVTDFIKHPIDSFYYLKKGQKGSYLGATIIYFVFFIVFLVFTLYKGFYFQYVEAADADLTAIVLGFFGLSLLFVLCNYLVTSINDGEGSIGQIYKGLMYSLLPLIVSYLLATWSSYIFTSNEAFVWDLIKNAGLYWTLIIMFLALQETHNYTIRNNIKSILMTFLFMAIIIIILAFLQIMGDQLIQFIISIVKELIRNVFN